MNAVKQFFVGLVFKQPVIFYGVGTLLAAAASRGLPIDTPEIKDGLTGLIVALGAKLLHSGVVSPATNLAQNVQTGKLAVQQLDGMQVGAPGVLPLTAEPIVNRIATEVAAQAGGAAGKLAENVATSVIGSVSGRLGKFNPFRK